MLTCSCSWFSLKIHNASAANTYSRCYALPPKSGIILLIHHFLGIHLIMISWGSDQKITRIVCKWTRFLPPHFAIAKVWITNNLQNKFHLMIPETFLQSTNFFPRHPFSKWLDGSCSHIPEVFLCKYLSWDFTHTIKTQL